MVAKKILSFLLSLLTLLASMLGIVTTTGRPTVPADDFVPVLRFVATSDTHIVLPGDMQCARITKMLESAYFIAESDHEYPYLDAAAFSGDITDQGTRAQFMAFGTTAANELRGDTKLLACVAKSHDCNAMGRDALAFFSSVTGLPTDFHEVIKGYHFIGLSASPDESVHYSVAQLSWLDEQLAAAVADAPAQPVFVFQHEHIKNTVFGSYPEDGWGVDYFTDILSKYPQVVDISGHSHYPANDPRAVWQGAFTAINDGGLAYFEFTVDGENSIHPANSKTMAQMLLIEVDAANRVLVRVYDLTAEKFVYEYMLDNVTDPALFTYTEAKRAAAATAPVFAEDARIALEKAATVCSFSFPQAVAGADDIVYLYRLSVQNEAGECVLSDWTFSDYYMAEVPATVSFNKKILPAGEYTACVVAESAYGVQSMPLLLDFTVLG